MVRKLAMIGVVLVGFIGTMSCVTRVVYRQPPPQTPPPAYTGPAYEPQPEDAPTGYAQQPSYAPPSSEAPPDAGADVAMFYDDLAPYGAWVSVEGPGLVWQPRGVPAGWRPYTLGHWVYTDFGWTWVSDEAWGWAAYHYGRWHDAPGYGWVWVPGSEWGPAWVTWNSGGDWTGWAPLPWQVSWRAGVGLDWGNVDVRVAIRPESWCFLPTRHLADPYPRSHFVPAARNVTLINVTRNVTNYTVIDNRVFNQGVYVNTVSRAAGHPVPRLHVRQDDSPRRERGERVQGGELVVFRPGHWRGQESHGTRPATAPATADRGGRRPPADPADSRPTDARHVPSHGPNQGAAPNESPSHGRYENNPWQRKQSPDGSSPEASAAQRGSPDRGKQEPAKNQPEGKRIEPPTESTKTHPEEKKSAPQASQAQAKKAKRGKALGKNPKPESQEPVKTDDAGEKHP